MEQSDTDEADETDSAQAVAEELRSATGRFVRAARTAQLLPPGHVRALEFLDREGAMAITALVQTERVRHRFELCGSCCNRTCSRSIQM